jgi:hypothetical protein
VRRLSRRSAILSTGVRFSRVGVAESAWVGRGYTTAVSGTVSLVWLPVQAALTSVRSHTLFEAVVCFGEAWALNTLPPHTAWSHPVSSFSRSVDSLIGAALCAGRSVEAPSLRLCSLVLALQRPLLPPSSSCNRYSLQCVCLHSCSTWAAALTWHTFRIVGRRRIPCT